MLGIPHAQAITSYYKLLQAITQTQHTRVDTDTSRRTVHTGRNTERYTERHTRHAHGTYTHTLVPVSDRVRGGYTGAGPQAKRVDVCH
jgi:hypothetical protein